MYSESGKCTIGGGWTTSYQVGLPQQKPTVECITL